MLGNAGVDHGNGHLVISRVLQCIIGFDGGETPQARHLRIVEIDLIRAGEGTGGLALEIRLDRVYLRILGERLHILFCLLRIQRLR